MIEKSYNQSLRALEKNLEKLRGLFEVGETGSIHQAARRLGVSQPTLSRSLKNLEEALGVTLLSRGTRGIKLTAAGETLHGFATRLLRESSDIERKLRVGHDSLAGRIQVGTYESIAVYFWPAFLRQLTLSHPGLMIALSTIDESRHYRMLKSDKLQLVVSVEPPADDHLFSTILYQDRFSLFSAQHAPWAQSDSVLDAPLIYVPTAVDGQGRTIQRLLEEAQVQPRCTYEVDTFEAAKALALEGIGVAVLPCKVAEKDRLAGKLAPTSLPRLPARGFGEHRICATVRRENRLEPRLRLLIREIKRSWHREVERVD